MKSYLQILIISSFVLFISHNTRAQTITCGGSCGSCDVPNPNNPPNPASPGVYYTQKYNLYNDSQVYANNIELRADRAYFNGSSSNILPYINYQEQNPIFFSIPPNECKQVQFNYKINPSQSGEYKIYYKLYDGNYQLPTLPGGDLWVSLTIEAENCDPPNNLNVSTGSVTSNSAIISFDPSTQATATEVFWSVSSSGVWENIEVLNESVLISGLTPNTQYTVNARSICGGTYSDYVSNIYFTTSPSSTGDCEPPIGLYTDNIYTDHATANWNYVSGYQVYYIRYRETGMSWTYSESNTNSYYMNYLEVGAQHEWQVATLCSDELSEWSESIFFNTDCLTPPNAIFSMSKTEVLIGEEFNLTDLSTNYPTSWSWQIEDGSTGTYSAQNPINVSCISPGVKNIILTITNDCGSDTASATINVLPTYGNQPYNISDTRQPCHFHQNVGDPVNPYTGEFSYPINLMTILGIDKSFYFNITYNSLINNKTDLGWNWDYNYKYSLQIDSDLWTVTNSNGQQQFFVPYDDGSSVPLYTSEKDTMHVNNGVYILEKTNGFKIRFTTTGALQGINDRNGNEIDFVQNSSGNISRIKFPGNRYIRFYYNGNLLTRIENKDGKEVLFNYNANDELESLVNLDGDTITFNYNTTHQITSIIDGNSHTLVSNVYNGDGKVELQTDAEGNSIGFDYDNPEVGATRIKNAENNYSYYYHDSHGRLLNNIDEEGYETKYIINDIGKPSRTINANDETTWFTYDGNQNLKSIETQTHAITHLEFNNFHQLTKIIDPLNNPTDITYDSFGNRKLVNLPNGSVIEDSVDSYGRALWTKHNNQKQSFVYSHINQGGDLTGVYDDDNNDYYFDRARKTGFIKRIADRNGVSVNFLYTNSGIITEKKYEDNTTEIYGYDSNQNLISYEDRNGNTTLYEYYDNDWLKSITNALNQTTTIEYTPTGLPKKYTYPNGDTEELTYYKNGWLKTFTDNLGTILYTYDNAGRVKTVTDRMNRISNFDYDEDGRLTSAINPLGQETQWQYNNRDLTAIINALNDSTHFEYGVMGELKKATDPLQKFNRMEYDPLMNLNQIFDANNHMTNQVFDNRSLLESKILPTGDTYSYTYDDETLLKTFTDPNGIIGTITRNYNDNRIWKVNYSNGAYYEYNYLPSGEITQASNGSENMSFDYNELGQLTQETGTFNDTIQYVYDPISNELVQIIYPGNKTIQYSYSNGLVSRVEDWNGNWADYSYFTSGTLQEIEYSNGVITTFTRDDLDQIVTQLTKKGADTICYYHLTRNDMNHIIGIEKNQPLMPTYTNELVSVNYDESDRPQSTGNNTFSNDSNGNLLHFDNGVDTFEYSYAEDNRITSSTFNGETILREYNPLRKPVKLIKNGVETRYTFSNGLGLSKPIQQRDGTNAVVQDYIYGVDGLAWMIDQNGEPHFYHGNNLGNIVALTDTNGDITDQLACDPWGASINKIENTDQPFGYMGKYGVIDLGNTQYIVGARDYVGTIGRFVSPDEYPANLMNTQSNQRYSMAINSPYNYVDPSGYKAELFIRTSNITWDSLTRTNDIRKNFQTTDFGHVMIKVDNYYYGFATEREKLNDVQRYNQSDFNLKYKGKTWYSVPLNTTERQDRKIENYYDSLKPSSVEGMGGEYRTFSNNCTTTAQDALNYAGLDNFNIGKVTPNGFYVGLKMSNLKENIISYFFSDYENKAVKFSQIRVRSKSKKIIREFK